MYIERAPLFVRKTNLGKRKVRVESSRIHHSPDLPLGSSKQCAGFENLLSILYAAICSFSKRWMFWCAEKAEIQLGRQHRLTGNLEKVHIGLVFCYFLLVERTSNLTTPNWHAEKFNKDANINWPGNEKRIEICRKRLVTDVKSSWVSMQPRTSLEKSIHRVCIFYK